MLNDSKGLREIERLAQKYIWWKPVSESVKIPELVAAQVMNLGDYDDGAAIRLPVDSVRKSFNPKSAPADNPVFGACSGC